jgi:hypothetical protein
MLCAVISISGPLVKSGDGKQLATDADMKPTFTTWLQTFGSDFLYAGIKP